jgi:hypothetical protein
MTSKEFTYAMKSLMDFDANHFFDNNILYYPVMQRQMLRLTIKTGAYIIHNLPNSRKEVDLYYSTINELLGYIENKEIYDAIEGYNKTFDKMIIAIDGK